MVPEPSTARREASIEEVRVAEREATLRLRQVIRSSEERLREAAGRLAEFDAMLDGVKALLWRDGYLR